MPQRPAPASSRVVVLAAAALLSLFTFFVPATQDVRGPLPEGPAPTAAWGGHPAAYAVLTAHAGRVAHPEAAPQPHTGPPVAALTHARVPVDPRVGPGAAAASGGQGSLVRKGTVAPRAPPHGPRSEATVISA
ncbi:hypothetical protein ACIBL6_11460 [Streptomyces sp. NPDC050400]|uniref:hypothetical protein n=1 Tax=Streptomyces sp. NPDC050400 TaxID=3365610 RepID=UPI0037BB5999